jgi:hypothetical protein
LQLRCLALGSDAKNDAHRAAAGWIGCAAVMRRQDCALMLMVRRSSQRGVGGVCGMIGPVVRIVG